MSTPIRHDTMHFSLQRLQEKKYATRDTDEKEQKIDIESSGKISKQRAEKNDLAKNRLQEAQSTNVNKIHNNQEHSKNNDEKIDGVPNNINKKGHSFVNENNEGIKEPGKQKDYVVPVSKEGKFFEKYLKSWRPNNPVILNSEKEFISATVMNLQDDIIKKNDRYCYIKVSGETFETLCRSGFKMKLHSTDGTIKPFTIKVNRNYFSSNWKEAALDLRRDLQIFGDRNLNEVFDELEFALRLLNYKVNANKESVITVPNYLESFTKPYFDHLGLSEHDITTLEAGGGKKYFIEMSREESNQLTKNVRNINKRLGRRVGYILKLLIATGYIRNGIPTNNRYDTTDLFSTNATASFPIPPEQKRAG